MERQSLRPEENVFRFVFSSSAYFVGECDGEAFNLTFAFPSWSRQSAFNQHTFEASHFVLSIRTEKRNAASIHIPTYEWVGEELSALLCITFGKLIVNLGHIQSGFSLCVPVETKPPIGDRWRTPFNGTPRKPNGPELNLTTAKGMIDCYIADRGDERLGYILRAAEFYRAALENFHKRAELSLTLFCSALEAVLPLRQYTERELFDENLLQMLTSIETLPNGRQISEAVKSRLFQIKRKVAALVTHYVPDSFFTERESEVEWGVIKDREDLLARIRRVYDLRSMVLHTGNREGLWFLEHDHGRSEIGLGAPSIDNKDLKKALAGGLTLTGLERVTWSVLRAALSEWIDGVTSAAGSQGMAM